MLKLLNSNSKLRLLTLNRVLINLGDSLYYIAIMWIIYEITEDTMYTGIAGFLFSFPEVLGFFAGPIIDRKDKPFLLNFASFIQLLTISIILLLEIFNLLNIWILLITIPIFSAASEFTYPINSTLLPEIVENEDLVLGNSIMVISSTGIDLVFNAIAGVLLSILTIKSIFLVNSGINLSALLCAFIFGKLFKKHRLRTTNKLNAKSNITIKRYVKDLKDSIRFLKNRTLLYLLLPLILVNLFYAIMKVNLPEFSQNVFGSAFGYGLILSFTAIGSMIGSSMSGKVSKKIRIGIVLPVLFLLTGISWTLMFLSIEFSPYISGLFIILAASMNGLVNILYSTLFQQLPPRDMIGRIHTLNMSLIACAIPIGSLLGGILCRYIPTNFVFFLYGVSFLCISIFMLLSKDIRCLPNLNQINYEYLE